MWIKGTDGRLHDTTGCTIECQLTSKLLAEGRVAPKTYKADSKGFSIIRVGGRNDETLADALDKERAKSAMQKIEQAIMARAPLVEI